MARLAIIFGLLLCGLTIVGLVGTTIKSPSLFVPMMLGIPILFCGVVSLNPHRRRQAMQVATIVGLLGSVAGGGSAIYSAMQWVHGDHINRYALTLVAAMSVVCLVFVVLCLYSFIQARKKRSVAEAAS